MFRNKVSEFKKNAIVHLRIWFADCLTDSATRRAFPISLPTGTQATYPTHPATALYPVLRLWRLFNNFHTCTASEPCGAGLYQLPCEVITANATRSLDLYIRR